MKLSISQIHAIEKLTGLKCDELIEAIEFEEREFPESEILDENHISFTDEEENVTLLWTHKFNSKDIEIEFYEQVEQSDGVGKWSEPMPMAIPQKWWVEISKIMGWK